MQDTSGNIAENKELQKKQETVETLDMFLSKDEEERVNEDLVPNAGKVHLDPARRWGKGIIGDFRNTVGKYWVSEMINFNQKTVAVSLLMFITIISPTLAFGAAYSKNTGNNIGAIETILATAYVGCASSLLSGMPMMIVGSTGPILAVTTALYSLSQSFGVPFLPFYAWVSIWTLGYIVLCTLFDFTRYVKMATRFTDDIFALLIVTIFVLDAIGDPFSQSGLLRYLMPDHKSHGVYGDDPDYSKQASAYLSILLGLGTTWLIFWLRNYKTTSFFYTQGVRNLICDFSVIASVLVFTMLDKLAFTDTKTESLKVPNDFEPTYQCCDSTCNTSWPSQCGDLVEPYGSRPWVTNLFDLNGNNWVVFGAAGPAILSFLAIYLDNGITWHLILSPSHKLQHGESYSWDLLLNGVLNCINGLLGLPWLVASTVPCIVHLNNLAEKDKDGKFISVQETRLTNLFAHFILGMSLLFLNVIKMIPLPVLYGLFLFMGLSALPGLQFWQRFLLFFRQPDLYPETPYTTYMDKMRVHKYTIFQLVFFAGVFVVQNTKQISIAFPFMTLLCIPARLYLAPKFFHGWELCLLDGEDDQIKEWVDAKEGRWNKEVEDAVDDDVEHGSSKDFGSVDGLSVEEFEA